MSNSPIEHVFVLMLENRSFDHIFGLSGIPGINGLTGDESNSYDDHGAVTNYKVGTPAVDPMTTDSNHEFLDTMEQLCGTYYKPHKDPKKDHNPFPKGPYPHIYNKGFVANYATVADEGTGLPGFKHYGDVMKCASPDQVPVTVQLAKEFAICDQWYSSMPGPTWPNRMFAMGATASGLDVTPNDKQIFKWEIFDGFKMVKGNFFHMLHKKGMGYRLYHDSANEFAYPPAAPFYEGGGFSIVSALEDVHLWDVHSFRHFKKDLHGHYPYQYTFIEPNYGDTTSDSYQHGSSQHPEDWLVGGERLLAATYNAIRNSPLWNKSMLIVTYDEHGGFYDHVAPPAACSPADDPDYGYNVHGFNFENYGVRVPAVIISPWIAKGTVDKNLYDHTSILRTVEKNWDLPNLTQRDLNAASLLTLLTEPSPRTDCPKEVTANEPEIVEAIEPNNAEIDFADPTPLVSQGNVIGHLHVAMKADYEMSDRSEASKEAIRAKVAAIKTKGQARAYFAEVWAKLQMKKSTI